MTAGAANVVPDEVVAVARLVHAGDLAGAREQWQRLYPVIDALFSVPFIPAVKAGLELQGLPVGSPRRPTAPLTAAEVDSLRPLLATLVPEVV